VDRRQAEKVGELFLGDRHVDPIRRLRHGDVQAIDEFAKEVREAGQRVAPADVEKPFASDRRLDQYVDEECAGDGRSGPYQFLKGPYGHDGKVCDGQRLKIVVCNPQKQRLQVERITGHLERHDLASPIGGELVPIGKA
jgi:hypothetical protein